MAYLCVQPIGPACPTALIEPIPSVLSKAVEQTPLIAAHIVRILREAGVPLFNPP